LWHFAAQSQCGGISAAGESGLCIVIATSAEGSAHYHALLRFLSGAAGEHGNVRFGGKNLL
jgi:hypothetical protein